MTITNENAQNALKRAREIAETPQEARTDAMLNEGWALRDAAIRKKGDSDPAAVVAGQICKMLSQIALRPDMD